MSMKNLTVLTVGLSVLASMAVTPAFAQSAPQAKVIHLQFDSAVATINGKAFDLTYPAHLMNNSLYAWVRPLAEALGATVTWDGKAHTATLQVGNRTVVFTEDSDWVWINGQKVQLPAAAHTVAGHMQVPVRILVEALGDAVMVDGNSVTIAENVSTSTPASDLRVTLDRLLGEHAALAMLAMQKGYDGSSDFPATAAALGQNTADLTAAIGSVYGKDAAAAFNKMWSDHIGFFVDYVVATKKGDTAGKTKAVAELEQYRNDFSKFLAGANPNYKQGDLANGLQAHIRQLLGAFDSYVAGDYSTTYADMREAYAHMYATGGLLATGIVKQFPAKFDYTDPNTKAANLRVALDQMLGEHAFLAMVAMQKGIDGAPDFHAAATALAQNTNDLTAAIGSVYGDAAAAAFKKQWSDHIGFFVDYVVGTAKKDDSARQKALDELAQYRQTFSKFLAGANANFDATALSGSLQEHVTQLVGAFDNYHQANYSAAYDFVRQGYAHMFMSGDYLASGIVAQYPEKFTR